MASKKSKATAKRNQPLENLAARPSFDEALDEQLVDHSGVFRVTAAIAQAQTGHDEEATLRFASDSLVMAAQRDGFREEGVTIEDAVEENVVDDETLRAQKRQRLATLAERARARRR